jgi:hypothetical protein
VYATLGTHFTHLARQRNPEGGIRQALALDENRGNFIPSVWDHSRTDPNYQNAVEVWFKGGHSDIGGGAHETEAFRGDAYSSAFLDGDKFPRKPLLSNITLRWMVRQCFELETGILFDTDAMRRYRDERVLELRLVGNDLQKQRQALVDKLDAYDITPEPWLALEKAHGWGLLEYLPVPKINQLGDQRSQPTTVWRFVNLIAVVTLLTQTTTAPMLIQRGLSTVETSSRTRFISIVLSSAISKL